MYLLELAQLSKAIEKNFVPCMVVQNHQEATVTYGYIGDAHWAEQIRPQRWAANTCPPRR